MWGFGKCSWLNTLEESLIKTQKGSFSHICEVLGSVVDQKPEKSRWLNPEKDILAW